LSDPHWREDVTGDEDVLSCPRVALRFARRPPPHIFCLRIFGKCVAWTVVALGVAVGGLLFALSRGPITFDWLAPKIVESLTELSRGRYEFSLRAATLAMMDHGPTLSVDGLSVASGGRVVFAAPRAQLSVDLRSLLFGRISPRRIEALDLELRLAIMPDGAVAISAGADPQGVTVLAPAAPPAGGTALVEAPHLARVALLHQAADAMRRIADLATAPDGAIGGLQRLGLVHGRLVIDDRTVGRTTSYDDLTVSFDKGHGEMTFEFGANGPSRRVGATARAGAGADGRRLFDARLHDVTTDEIALLVGLRNLKFDSDAPLALDLHFALGSDGHVAEASGGFSVGRGFFRLDDPDHEPVMIDAINGAAHWDRAGRRLVVSPLEVKAGGYDAAFVGEAAPQRVEQNAVEQDVWALSARLTRPARVAPDHAGGRGVVLDRANFAARLLPAEQKLALDKIDIGGPEATLAYAGSFSWRDGPRLTYRLELADTQFPALTRLWPTHVASGLRKWMQDHVTQGVVHRALIAADFDFPALRAMRYERPPPDEAVRGEIEIVDATLIEATQGLAPFTGVTGLLRLTGRTAHFSATAGAMETAPGHRLQMTEGSFTVPDNGLRPAPAILEMKLSGGVEAVGDILALPSITPYANAPIDTASLKGQIDGRLRVDFELGPEARQDHTMVSIDAMTSNLTIDRFVGAERLENGALSILVDHAGLRVGGSGKLYGAPATLDLKRARGDRGAAQGQMTLTFDDAARAKAGFALPGVSGVVSATLKTSVPITDADTQAELDLAKAALDNPMPGLVKAAGKPGKASFVIARRADGIALDQFAFDAGGAQIAGVIELAKDGGFRSAKLSQVKLSPGDDLRVEAQRGADGLKLVARGANFDARSALDHLLRAPSEARAAPAAAPGAKPQMSFDDFDLDLKSGLVSGHGKQILTNVDLKLERRGGRLRAFSLTGKFGREPFAAALARGGGPPQIDLSTADGGSLFAFLDFYKRMDGGALNASVQLGGAGASGTLHIRDFYLKNEPTVRQLMSQGAVRSDASGVTRFDPESVRIGQLQVGWAYSGGVLTLRDGVMSGPEMGLTFDGVVDFPRERVDMSGAYVPAYGLNSLLSNIPVLGVVLAGGRHEGVFALNYRATGQLASPQVNVNPLSVIAPGMMRKIMGVMDGTQRLPDALPQR
jgi:hypothetical protein